MLESSLSAFEHEQLLGAGIAEAKLAIKTTAVGGHQVHPLHTSHAWGVQELLPRAAAAPMAL